ncbi:MAG: helix-turn-helix transcriptional regulator [Propionibacteriaceae bacterium]|nr:helix-turn-helix transcriptional regulator [Propionibacteriaceae bacterium]
MTVVLMREMVGETLRALRVSSGKTLREVSAQARVSLGYLSEVERGHKEASSELLNAICGALDVELSHVLTLTSERARAHENVTHLPVRADRAAVA